MTRTLLATAVGTLLLLGLTSCRSSDGNSGSNIGSGNGNGNVGNNPSAPSRFTSTDQVAQVARVIGGGLGNPSGITSSTATAQTQNRSSTMMFPSRAAAQSTATDNARTGAPTSNVAEACGDGGTYEVTPDESTKYRSDGLRTYVNCRYRDVDSLSGAITTSSTDGKRADKCTDAAQTERVCNARTYRYADGAAGKTDLIDNFAYKSSAANIDYTFYERADSTQSRSGATSTVTISGALRYVDNVGKREYSEITDNLKSVFTETENGGTQRLDGGYGLGSTTPQCAIGKMRIATGTPLAYDSSYSIVAGRLTLTDSAGQAATVEYASDSSVKVTLSNGTTRTYSATELGKFCN